MDSGRGGTRAAGSSSGLLCPPAPGWAGGGPGEAASATTRQGTAPLSLAECFARKPVCFLHSAACSVLCRETYASLEHDCASDKIRMPLNSERSLGINRQQAFLGHSAQSRGVWTCYKSQPQSSSWHREPQKSAPTAGAGAAGGTPQFAPSAIPNPMVIDVCMIYKYVSEAEYPAEFLLQIHCVVVGMQALCIRM